MGMFNEDGIEADVLLACIVVLSMWTTLWNPQIDQKACFNKFVKLSTGVCPTRWNILSGSAYWQQMLHSIPRRYTRWRPTVANASLMSGTSLRGSSHTQKTHARTFYVRKRVYIPYTSVWERAVSLVLSWNGKLLAAWNRSRRVLRTIEHWCRSLWACHRLLERAVLLDTKQKISNNTVLLTAGNTQLEHIVNLALWNLSSNSFSKFVYASLPKHRSISSIGATLAVGSAVIILDRVQRWLEWPKFS